jgi:hypothetical protein
MAQGMKPRSTAQERWDAALQDNVPHTFGDEAEEQHTGGEETERNQPNKHRITTPTTITTQTPHKQTN